MFSILGVAVVVSSDFLAVAIAGADLIVVSVVSQLSEMQRMLLFWCSGGGGICRSVTRLFFE